MRPQDVPEIDEQADFGAEALRAQTASGEPHEQDGGSHDLAKDPHGAPATAAGPTQPAAGPELSQRCTASSGYCWCVMCIDIVYMYIYTKAAGSKRNL